MENTSFTFPSSLRWINFFHFGVELEMLSRIFALCFIFKDIYKDNN